jgi:hypothetical protein
MEEGPIVPSDGPKSRPVQCNENLAPVTTGCTLRWPGIGRVLPVSTDPLLHYRSRHPSLSTSNSLATIRVLPVFPSLLTVRRLPTLHLPSRAFQSVTKRISSMPPVQRCSMEPLLLYLRAQQAFTLFLQPEPFPSMNDLFLSHAPTLLARPRPQDRFPHGERPRPLPPLVSRPHFSNGPPMFNSRLPALSRHHFRIQVKEH